MKECPICRGNDSRFERQLRSMDLVRCPACSFVYLDLSDEKIEEANASFAGDHESLYEKIQTGTDRIWHQHLVDLFTKKLGKPGKVLDIGCGNGLLLKAFKEHGWEPYGVDLSSWSKDYAERYGFEFFHGKVENSEFERESFDLVINLSTFEHVTRPIDFIQALAAFVRPGGYAYMAGIPNYGSLSVRLGLSTFHHNVPPKHCNYFSPGAIRALRDHMSHPGVTIDYKTYGIPELHRFYNWVTSVKGRGASSPSPKKSTADAQSRQADSGYTAVLNKAVVLANYYAGRIGSLGDKLEVYVMKE